MHMQVEKDYTVDQRLISARIIVSVILNSKATCSQKTPACAHLH